MANYGRNNILIIIFPLSVKLRLVNKRFNFLVIEKEYDKRKSIYAVVKAADSIINPFF